MNTFPVTFTADYVEGRSRLTTFFRWLIAIPHFIVVALYGMVAYLAVVVAWIALLVTGRYPQGLYDFVAGFLRYWTRVTGYILLLADPFPPFSGDPDVAYPVNLAIGPPKESYNRLKVFFRFFYAIPAYLIAYVMMIVAELAALASWFVILFTGKQPKGLQDVISLGVSYNQRAYALFFLLAETYPPFNDEHNSQIGTKPEPPAFEPPTAAAPAQPAAPQTPDPFGQQ